MDTLSEIRTLLRGFDERDDIIGILCEEMYEPGELNEQEVQWDGTFVHRIFIPDMGWKRR